MCKIYFLRPITVFDGGTGLNLVWGNLGEETIRSWKREDTGRNIVGQSRFYDGSVKSLLDTGVID